MTGRYGAQGNGQKPSLFSVISTPVLIIVLATALLVYNLVGLISALVNGGEIVYEEETLNTYIDNAYNGVFKNASAPKSGLAVILFYNEDTGAMEYVVEAGENISSSVTAIFGSDGEFGKYLTDNVRTEDFKKTLSDDLSGAMVHMATKVKELDLITPFIKNHDLSDMPKSELVTDKTEFNIDKAKVNASLEKFTQETGIPAVMVVDTSVGAFGRTIPTTDIIMVVLIVLVIVLCVFNLIKKIREYKRMESDLAAQPQIRVNARSPYYDEDDEESPSKDENSEDDEEANGEEEALNGEGSAHDDKAYYGENVINDEEPELEDVEAYEEEEDFDGEEETQSNEDSEYGEDDNGDVEDALTDDQGSEDEEEAYDPEAYEEDEAYSDEDDIQE